MSFNTNNHLPLSTCKICGIKQDLYFKPNYHQNETVYFCETNATFGKASNLTSFI